MIPKHSANSSCNLLDRVEVLVNAGRHDRLITARVAYAATDHDVHLVGPASEMQKLIATGPASLVAPIATRICDSSIQLSFCDDELVELGERLEQGVPDPFCLRTLAHGDHWLVNFASPNASKAFHVGHLRNIALGNAFAKLAETAGASVVTQSRIGDFGRNMGEAVAGYLEGFLDQTPVKAQEKSDRFVGRCYAEYVHRGHRGSGAGQIDGALGREGVIAEDAAEFQLRQWQRGDHDALELFARIRDWGVTGQQETLARLGVHMDRVIYESAFLEHGASLVSSALERRLAQRSDTGAIVYSTGDQSYPHILLVRADGFPTQNLRYIATWDTIGRQLEGVRTVSVLGAEWGPLALHTSRLLAAMTVADEIHPTWSVVHGMVATDSGDLHSSTGDVLLVDDLLDELLTSSEIAQLSARHPSCESERALATAVLGYFLTRSTRHALTFSAEDVLNDETNPGWTIARAWALASDPAFSGRADPEPRDPTYRQALVRSQLCRRLVLRCLHHMELAPLARYAAHLSRWFLSLDPTARVSRVMRTLLESCMGALGLTAPLP